MDINALKSMKSKVFLGTSSFSDAYFIPSDYITNAIKSGLEGMLCFETDHAIQNSPLNYNNYFEAMKETIPRNENIFENNPKKFLE